MVENLSLNVFPGILVLPAVMVIENILYPVLPLLVELFIYGEKLEFKCLLPYNVLPAVVVIVNILYPALSYMKGRNEIFIV